MLIKSFPPSRRQFRGTSFAGVLAGHQFHQANHQRFLMFLDESEVFLIVHLQVLLQTKHNIGSKGPGLYATKQASEIYQEEDNINHEERIRKLGEILDKVESEAPTANNNNSLYTGDYYLHSRVLKDTSELTKRCTEQVTDDVNNYDKFALAQSIAENPQFWDFTFPYEVPVVAYLFGTFAPTPPEERPKVPRRRVERQRPGDVKAPQQLEQVSKKPDEGTERVQQVLRFVTKACKNGPVSYFHLALHPTSFTRTIENIYDLSFLARDGLVAVTLDEKTGLPFLTKLGGEKKRRAEDNVENQFVVSLDMKRWRELTEAFSIRQPMMR